jgi:hypothetical protein
VVYAGPEDCDQGRNLPHIETSMLDRDDKQLSLFLKGGARTFHLSERPGRAPNRFACQTCNGSNNAIIRLPDLQHTINGANNEGLINPPTAAATGKWASPIGAAAAPACAGAGHLR